MSARELHGTARDFARAMVEQLDAHVVPCRPTDVSSLRSDQEALCAALDLDDKAFRQAWKEALRESPVRVESKSNWQGRKSGVLKRLYRADFAPVAVTKDLDGPLLVFVYSRLGRCKDGWYDGPAVSEEGCQEVGEVAAGELVCPKRTQNSFAVFPKEELVNRRSAAVSLTIVVGIDGSVRAACIREANPASRAFMYSAATAAIQWKYTPGTVDGDPVEVYVDAYLTFEIAGAPIPPLETVQP